MFVWRVATAEGEYVRCFGFNATYDYNAMVKAVAVAGDVIVQIFADN